MNALLELLCDREPLATDFQNCVWETYKLGMSYLLCKEIINGQTNRIPGVQADQGRFYTA